MSLAEIQAKFGGKWKVERTGNNQPTPSSNEEERRREDTRIYSQTFQEEYGKVVITVHRRDTQSTSEYVLEGETVTEDWGVKHRGSARYVDGKLTTVLTPMDSDVVVKTVQRELVDGKTVLTSFDIKTFVGIIFGRVYKRRGTLSIMALAEIQAKFGGKWKIERNDDTESNIDSVELQVKDGAIVTTPYRQGGNTRTSVYKLDEETEVEEAGVKHRGWASYEGGKLTTIVKPMDSEVPVRIIIREIVDGKYVATINSRGREWTSSYFKQ